MSNVRAYTDQQILDRVSSLSTFKGWPKDVLDVWVRSGEDATDVFDDKVYTYDCTGGTPRFVMVCSGTSNPGKGGLLGFMKWNRKGCAVLKADQIVYESHRYGFHKGDRNHPAYRQVKPIDYHRDNDRDGKSEELGPVISGEIIGANCHRAGWLSVAIGNWSWGCLVRNSRAQFDKWLKFMNKRPLSVAILSEW